MNTQKTVKDKKKRELGHKVGQLRSDTGYDVAYKSLVPIITRLYFLLQVLL